MTTEARTNASGTPVTEAEWTAEVQDRVIDSLLAAGDISKLNAEDSRSHYKDVCKSLGLNPATQPLIPLKLNGKTIYYPGRGTTDQLAARWRVTRRLVRGPEVVSIEGQKFMECVIEAVLPNGRSEIDLATVPLSDFANVKMKCITKAKRRATLAILGLGFIDETEVDGLEDDPTTYKRTAADGTVSMETNVPLVIQKMRDDLAQFESPTKEALVTVWLDHREELNREAGGEVEVIERAQSELLAKAPFSMSKNEFGELVRIADAREQHSEFDAFCKVLAMAEIPTDVVEIWRSHREAVNALPAHVADIARKHAAHKVGSLDSSITQAGKWLKNAVEAADKAANGNVAPKRAPANEAAPLVAEVKRDVVKSAADWTDHLASEPNEHAVANAYIKRRGAFAIGCTNDVRRQQTVAELGKRGIEHPEEFLRAAESKKERR